MGVNSYTSGGCSNAGCLSDASASGTWGSHGHSVNMVTGGSTTSFLHSHTVYVSAWGGYAAASDHTHTIPTNSVTTGGGNAQHTIAHANTMITEPTDPTSQTRFPKTTDTGNSTHMLTLTVEINGSNVPGSPFADYYVGDTISDIDITSLVTIATDNAIDISIAEYAGSSPVKCSLYGSVNSLYVLTSI